MKYLITIICFSISCFCIGQPESGFTLEGKTRDIPNGTLLLLQDPLLEKFIDTAEVNNNTFLLQTQLKKFPIKTTLWLDGSTAKTIWIENNKMTFDASATSFAEALIFGSKTDSLATVQRNQTLALESYDEMVAQELKFIKNNPNSILSAHNLSIMASVFGKEKSTKLFHAFSEANKRSEYGEKIAAFLGLELPRAPIIGENFVDFTMKNQDGKPEKLSEIKDKVILLEFWASWCAPCRKENPELVKTYAKYKNKGLEILAISLDENKENWIKAIQKDKLVWKHVSDLKGRENIASLIYRVHAIPDNFLIDKNGIIISRNVRGEKLNNVLAEIFK